MLWLWLHRDLPTVHSRALLTLERSLFSNAVRLLFAGGREQFGKALGNIVSTGFGFSICFIFIPTFFDTLDISCRQSWVWAPHERSLRPLHLALVLSIWLVHCLLNLWSVGNFNEVTPSLWELLYPATTQRFPMFRRTESFPLVRHAIATPLNGSKLKYGRCS